MWGSGRLAVQVCQDKPSLVSPIKDTRATGQQVTPAHYSLVGMTISNSCLVEWPYLHCRAFSQLSSDVYSLYTVTT